MENKSLKPIVLKSHLDIVYFNYDEIIMFEADGNCSVLYPTERNCTIKILHNISFIEKKYCNEILSRCHKSYIINLVYLEKLMIRKRQVQLKRGLIAKLSPTWLEKIRKMSGLDRHGI